MKQNHIVKLKDFPRLTMLIKGYDTDIKDKATFFGDTEIKSFMLGNRESLAFFGGFAWRSPTTSFWRRWSGTHDVYKITHSRCKQRSDQPATAFLVPAQGGFAAHALANTWQRSTVAWTSSPAGYGGPRPRAVKVGAYLSALNPHSIFKRSFYLFNIALYYKDLTRMN